VTRPDAYDGWDTTAAEKLIADALDDDHFISCLMDTALSPGTCQMVLRALNMSKRPTPPELRAAARFFRADWRAVCVLCGWAQTAEGEWLDVEAEGFSWDRVRPESLTTHVRSPTGQEWHNQELAAFAIMRSLRD
jgi:hypothetical protein